MLKRDSGKVNMDIVADIRKITVLHEYGAPTHYSGLRNYCEANNIKIVFREFTWLRPLIRAIIRFDAAKIKRSITNIGYLVGLLFSKNQHVVLGIAPYDSKMIFFCLIAKAHKVYYHTSWPTWDGSSFPKKIKFNLLNKTVMSKWRVFLEDNCSSIFCVSTNTMRQLESNYRISCPIGVVYHSVHPNFVARKCLDIKTPLKLLFTGRLTKEKGINEIIELLNVFGNRIEIGIVGEGELENFVQSTASKHSNFIYHGKVEHSRLYEIYQQYDVLLCPSKKGYGDWEELFGMVIIEGMICGLIPIATDHNGPKEIIDNGSNGYIIRDEYLFKDLVQAIRKLLQNTAAKNRLLKSEAIRRGEMFLESNIAVRWESILKSTLTKET